ncbi:MAG: type II secretion system F family protein [Alphaproteobacteria bacterium]|nr:type II secretion system F family protein [Alphaproteobacteria bacterium]
MSFLLEGNYLFYIFAAGSTVLFVEAIYLLCFSSHSYRSSINRRLRLMKDQPNRENVLVQLRRERGLTGGGGYAMRILSLNRLVLQSGLTLGLRRIVWVALAAAALVFVLVWWVRDDFYEAGVVALIGAAVLPYLGFVLMRARRQGKFGQQFPDAIDIIVRSLRAGHPVPVAISMVARELPDPVGTEFGIVADEITYGADLETAMRNLSYRVGQEDLPLFVTAIAIQGATGGNLSEILQNLSRVIRERFKMRRKVKALASEGKFSALFLSALPFVLFCMIRYVAPEFYGSVWKYDMTKVGLGMAAAWMVMGNLVMYRMVNFRI